MCFTRLLVGLVNNDCYLEPSSTRTEYHRLISFDIYPYKNNYYICITKYVCDTCPNKCVCVRFSWTLFTLVLYPRRLPPTV